MTNTAPIRRTSEHSEEGYMLVAVIVLVALLTIALAIALPKVSREIQRDRELETMQRGKQYIRAVRMYYKKFGAYPPNVDALVKPTNNIRFLRKKYPDPTTGKEDWKPVLVGQNKAPTAMGFFGKPFGGSGVGGIGLGAAGYGLPGSSLTPTPAADLSAPADPNNPNAANGGAAASTSAFGQTGQTFGGAGIMGFSPNSSKQSMMVYKTKNHYNEWEFVYDPMTDLMQPGIAPAPPPVQTGAPGVTNPSLGSSLTPTPTTPTTPTTDSGAQP